MVTRVIIVRHGQSNYNALKMIQGRCDESVLTEKGLADAKVVGETLKNLKVDGFYCSPLQRAKQTAETILASLKSPPLLNPVENLREIDLFLWEKKSKAEVRDSPEYQVWQQNPQDFKMLRSNSEDSEEFYPVLSLYDQAKQFWKEIIPRHQGETVLIVAHNGINRCLILSALGINPARYHTIQQSNCCINVLNFMGDWGDSVQVESLNQTAHLGIPVPPPRPSHNGPRLLLVRHGETQWNRESRFQGQIDIPLNDKGKQQGQQAAEFLKDVTLDFGVTSPLLRPKETAELILKYHSHITLEEESDLQEISHGLWEGKLKDEIQAEFGELLDQWEEAPETVQMPEGENLQQVWDRCVDCWQKIVSRYDQNAQSQTGIVVAHDAVNKVILCYLLGLKPENFWNIKQGNGAVSVIDYPQGSTGKPVLQAINITSHLSSGILDQTAAGAL